MKLRRLISAAAVFSIMSLGMATSAQAHRIINVQGNLYVIICDNNGGNFTFSGSAQGATDVSGLICPTALNGGSGTGTVATIEKATPAQAALNAKTGGGTVKECPSGTHWYEPAKACVANGGHPSL